MRAAKVRAYRSNFAGGLCLPEIPKATECSFFYLFDHTSQKDTHRIKDGTCQTQRMLLQAFVECVIRLAGGNRLCGIIIFVQNKRHAQFILKRFNKLYPQYKGTFAQRFVCID